MPCHIESVFSCLSFCTASLCHMGQVYYCEVCSYPSASVAMHFCSEVPYLRCPPCGGFQIRWRPPILCSLIVNVVRIITTVIPDSWGSS